MVDSKDAGRLVPIVAFLWFCWSPLTVAQDGLKLYQQGRFEEARQVLEGEPASADTRRWLALTYFQLLEYPLAQPLLRQVLLENPTDIVVRRALGEVYLELLELTAAQQTVITLIQENPEPRDWLLWGRVQEALGDFQRSESAYRQALDSTDPSIHQAAAVLLGKLYLRENRISELQFIIAAAEALDPDSLDAETLRAMQPQAFSGESTRATEWRLGYQLVYDDNVALASDQRAPSAADANQGDFRHLLYGGLLAQQSLGNGFRVFGEAHLAHGFHQDLDQFDFTRQNYLASLGWDGTRVGVRLPLEWLRIDQDGGHLFSRWSVTPGIYVRIDDATQLYGYLRFDDNDYQDTDVIASENRSGDSRSVGALLQWRGLDGRVQLRTLAELSDDDAEGENWQRERLRLYAYGEYRLNPRLLVAVGGEYLRDDYANRHDVLGEVREDRIGAVFGLLSYQLSSRWSLQMRIAHEAADSTLDAYDYDRTVVSAGINWQF